MAVDSAHSPERQEAAAPRPKRHGANLFNVEPSEAYVAGRLEYLFPKMKFAKGVLSQRQNAYFSQRGKCFYCNSRMWLETGAAQGRYSATRDHYTPLSKGGSKSASNIVCACYRCNNLKGGKTPLEWGMLRLIEGGAPAQEVAA